MHLLLYYIIRKFFSFNIVGHYRLHHDLADAKKKISALEDQLGKILKDKNRALEELTRKNSLLAEQLSASLAENEQLKLQQSTEDEELREQLDNALTELGELRKQYVLLVVVVCVYSCMVHPVGTPHYSLS